MTLKQQQKRIKLLKKYIVAGVKYLDKEIGKDWVKKNSKIN